MSEHESLLSNEFNKKWSKEIAAHKKQLLERYQSKIRFPTPPYSPEEITGYLQEVRPYLRRTKFFKRDIPIGLVVLLCLGIWVNNYRIQRSYESRAQVAYLEAKAIGWDSVKKPPAGSAKHTIHMFEESVFIQKQLHSRTEALLADAAAFGFDITVPVPPYDIKMIRPLEESVFVQKQLYERVQSLNTVYSDLDWKIITAGPPYEEMNIEYYEEELKSLQPFLKQDLSYQQVIKNRDKAALIVEKELSILPMMIPSGSFMMGCVDEDLDCGYNELPLHLVNLTKGFYMTKYEVTQGLYQEIMGHNPSHFYEEGSCTASQCPVEMVSWYDAVLFCNRLSDRVGLEPCYHIGAEEEPHVIWKSKDCMGWRLPTEAEWEYAAIGGQRSIYSGSDDIDESAWFRNNSIYKTQPVGKKKANGYGLYDMSGNVWEWVWDAALLDDNWEFTGLSGYTSSTQTDPVVSGSSPYRVNRGGSWVNSDRYARISFRNRYKASYRYSYRGFRVVRTLP